MIICEITQKRYLLTTLPFSHQCLRAKDEKLHPFKAMVSSKCFLCPSPLARWLQFCRKGSGTSVCKSGESLVKKQGDMKQLFAITVGLFLFDTELSGEKVGKILQHVENSSICVQISRSTETRQCLGVCYHCLMDGGISLVYLQRSSLCTSLIEELR